MLLIVVPRSRWTSTGPKSPKTAVVPEKAGVPKRNGFQTTETDSGGRFIGRALLGYADNFFPLARPPMPTDSATGDEFIRCEGSDRTLPGGRAGGIKSRSCCSATIIHTSFGMRNKKWPDQRDELDVSFFSCIFFSFSFF